MAKRDETKLVSQPRSSSSTRVLAAICALSERFSVNWRAKSSCNSFDWSRGHFHSHNSEKYVFNRWLIFERHLSCLQNWFDKLSLLWPITVLPLACHRLKKLSRVPQFYSFLSKRFEHKSWIINRFWNLLCVISLSNFTLIILQHSP